jgi:hypothetical protein
MKKILFAVFLFAFLGTKAQKVDSIFVNLYTDSLKKGTYNYINVDGLCSNGTYLPLDSNDIIFTASYGKFYGNSLWIDHNCKEEKVNINVVMRKNKAMHKEFVMYIKKKEDPALKTEAELLEEMRNGVKKKKAKNI